MTIAPSANQETIVLERLYAASPERVFRAFADVEARLRWGRPSEHAGLVYDKTDFRVGGLDVSRCGPRDNLVYRVETRYWDIVPETRIVTSEIVFQDPRPLSISLITVALEAADGGTRLTFTDQIVAFGGASMIAGSRAGYGAALDNLRAELAAAPNAA